jgi:hypothetical protein
VSPATAWGSNASFSLRMDYRIRVSKRFARSAIAHFSDDETVAKMEAPDFFCGSDLGHPPPAPDLVERSHLGPRPLTEYRL